MKIRNMENDNGRAIPNQFILEDGNGRVFFQSYDSMIAIIVRSNGCCSVTLGRNWDYSNTTGKYLNRFLKNHYNGQEWNRSKIQKAIDLETLRYDPELV